MRRLAREIARLRGGPGDGPALLALADRASPTARLLFEGDGRPRAAVDRRLRVLRTSAALDRLLGVNPSILAELFVPEAATPATQAVEAVFSFGALSPSPVATTIRRAGGVARAMSLSIIPVHEADGTVSGAILTLDPMAAAAEVQAGKLQAIGALAGGIAHDFNNLLQAIIGAGESLADRRDLPEAVRDDVALILGGARRGAALVHQLLAFSAQQTLQPRIVAVNQAVADLAPLLRRSLGERVRLTLLLEEPGRFVQIDPGQLDQVLLNLAVNARDAMPNGGALTLRTGRLTLLSPRNSGLGTIPPGRYVAIEVQDTGTGIPAAILPRIFEPFFTTGRERGTGLGLSSVIGIIQQSRGFLEVASTPGQGSVFRILLPRSQDPAVPAATQAAQSSPGETPGQARGTVLLVEDDDAVRRLAQRALERHGWRVLSADCGEGALALLAPDTAIACIVTDMIMPGIDGAALAQAVRTKLARPALPAIIVSGYAEVPLHDAIGASATAFLPKPYAMKELAARVAAVAQDMEPAQTA